MPTDVTKMKRTYRKPVKGDFPENLIVQLLKESDLRYGDNPNQAAALYRFLGAHHGENQKDLRMYDESDHASQTTRSLRGGFGNKTLAGYTNIQSVKTGKGGLSATNMRDISRAMEILKYFSVPTVAVMKHLVPSGVASQRNNQSLSEIYIHARDADARSAFGGVVVSNMPIDQSTAEAIMSSYVEVVASPEYLDGAMAHFEKKKDIRVATFENLDKIPKFVGDEIDGHRKGLIVDVQSMPTGRVLVQQPYLSSIRGIDDLVLDPLVTNKDGESVYVHTQPTVSQIRDMLDSWYINRGVRSNGIVIYKDGKTLAIGTGETERVGAFEQAIVKAYQKAMDREGVAYDPLDGASQRTLLRGNPLENASASSDAFFPFPDNIELAARVGISAIIQPGGSVRDFEVIDAANANDVAMAYTLERCFGHF